MQYTVKKHSKDEFYETYKSFLEQHQFPILSSEILGENIFVCYREETPIYAMPFWFTDSKICIIAFVASNKKVSYNQKRGGLDFLISEIIKYAKRKKMKTIYSTTTTDSVIESFENNGFIHGDLDSSQFFKVL